MTSTPGVISQSPDQVECRVLRQDDEDMEIPTEGWAGVVVREIVTIY